MGIFEFKGKKCRLVHLKEMTRFIYHLEEYQENHSEIMEAKFVAGMYGGK